MGFPSFVVSIVNPSRHPLVPRDCLSVWLRRQCISRQEAGEWLAIGGIDKTKALDCFLKECNVILWTSKELLGLPSYETVRGQSRDGRSSIGIVPRLKSVKAAETLIDERDGRAWIVKEEGFPVVCLASNEAIKLRKLGWSKAIGIPRSNVFPLFCGQILSLRGRIGDHIQCNSQDLTEVVQRQVLDTCWVQSGIPNTWPRLHDDWPCLGTRRRAKT